MTRLRSRLLSLVATMAVGGVIACDPHSREAPEPAPPPSAEAQAPGFRASESPSLVGHDGMVLVPFAGGRARLGGDNPVDPDDALEPRTIHLEPFLMDQHPVTAGQFAGCVQAGRCSPLPDPDDYARLACTVFDRLETDRPATCITREEAAAYCAAVGRRLPREEEWEAVARLVHGADPQPSEPTTAEDDEDSIRGVRRPEPVTGGLDSDDPDVPVIHGLLEGVREWMAGAFDGGSNVRIGLVDGRPRAPVRGRSVEDADVPRTVLVRRGEGEARRDRRVGFRCVVDATQREAASCTDEVCAWPPVPLPDLPARPDPVDVAGGEVRVGLPRALPREAAPVAFEVDAFRIDAVPVMAIEYERCLREGVCPRPRRDRFSIGCTLGRVGVEGHPMNCLDAGDAERYCAWTGGRLPTEVEWLRAVFGDGSHPYPWGPSWEEGRANRGGGEPHEPGEAERAWAFTSPVGAFDSDRSVWGLLDGGGNVSEWVREPVSPLAVPPDREGDRDLHRRLRALAGGDEEPPEHRVLGASWADSAHTDGRLIAHVVRRDAVGFRCVRP